MKNVIDSQQILKSRSYKKIMNDSSRDNWLKIMKNENKSLLINETWKLINFLRNRRVFRDQMSLQDQTKETRRDFTLQSAMNNSKFRTNRKIKLYEDVRRDD
jgi:uncharacterized protein YqgQ